MSRVAVTLFVVSNLLACTGAWADQTDPRLSGLFAELRDSPNEHAAGVIEKRIWEIWTQAPSTRSKLLFNTAQAAMNSGNLPVAREVLDRLIEIDPGFSEAWNQRAIVSYLLRDFEGSLRDIAKTLDLEPRHFGALSGRGQCYMYLDQPDRAVGAFENALKINPWLPSVKTQMEMLREYLESKPHAI